MYGIKRTASSAGQVRSTPVFRHSRQQEARELEPSIIGAAITMKIKWSA